MRWTVRPAEPTDAPVIAAMLGRFASGHPSAGVSRPPEAILRRSGYVSARAFHRMVNLAGATGRELAARFPEPAWNHDTAGIAQENQDDRSAEPPRSG